jgi:hypothetical protein
VSEKLITEFAPDFQNKIIQKSHTFYDDIHKQRHTFLIFKIQNHNF